MHEREESVSTYMGNFLAIPHGTNEAKDHIMKSALSVIRYTNGDRLERQGGEVRRRHRRHRTTSTSTSCPQIADHLLRQGRGGQLDAATHGRRSLRPVRRGQLASEGRSFRRRQHRARLRRPAAARRRVRGGVRRRRGRPDRPSSAAADSYTVHEVGEQPRVRTVDNFRALNIRHPGGRRRRGDRDGGHRHHRRGAAHPEVRRAA